MTTGPHGRSVWKIASDAISVSVTECGAHVAEITSRRTGVNPLWIQDQPTIDSDAYDPRLHGRLYGDDCEARLIAGLLGHNLCLPFWGAPSAAEFAAGMTTHGETNITRWRALDHQADRVRLEASLPESGIRVERTLSCRASLLLFETVAENVTSWDRPIAWCEHVTFGPPFLAHGHTGFYADLGQGYRTSGDSTDTFHWPEGRGAIPCDLRGFSEQAHSDLVNSFLVGASGEWACFAAWNAELRAMLGYVFQPAEFPWMNVWENHDSRRSTRGMEFSTTPIEGTMRALIAAPQVYGVPTFEWLPARSRLSKSFFSFTVDLPEHYRGLDAVTFDGRELSLQEIGTGNRMTLRA